jgi:HPt (histidine-containing phosphotransfer) domain-containing protein
MSDFEAALRELRRSYRDSLPSKLDEIDAAITARSLDTARALAHRLAGTAGSYGMAAIGSAAAAIEARIDAGGDPWDDLAQLLATARTVVRES